LHVTKVGGDLTVGASGTVPTGDGRMGHLSPYIYIVPPADGIYSFSFLAQPPSGNATQLITPIDARPYGWKNFPATLKVCALWPLQTR